METSPKYNKIIIALLVLVIGFSAFLLSKDKLFKQTAKNRPSEVVSDSTSTKVKNESPQNSESKTNPPSSPRPVYTGRDPKEVIPTESVVSKLPESYKKQVFNEIKVFGQTVLESPQYVSGWLQLGILKKIIGDYRGAGDAWEYASRVEGQQQYVAFSNLGDLYWQYLPDYPKSEANFKKSLSLKPDNVPAYISLSQLYEYSYKEKVNQVPGLLKQGIAANPDSVDLTKTLADFYERRGELSLALEWWRNSLKLRPDDADIQQRIGELEKKLNP